MRQILATEEEIRALGFDPKVLACKCCGVVRVDLGLLQRMRAVMDILITERKVWISCCCRCWKHHAAEYTRTGGTPPENSAHLITGKDGDERISTAMDFAGNFHDLQVLNAMVANWKGGFSFYNRGPEGGSSIHLDIGKRRRW